MYFEGCEKDICVWVKGLSVCECVGGQVGESAVVCKYVYGERVV